MSFGQELFQQEAAVAAARLRMERRPRVIDRLERDQRQTITADHNRSIYWVELSNIKVMRMRISVNFLKIMGFNMCTYYFLVVFSLDLHH